MDISERLEKLGLKKLAKGFSKKKEIIDKMKIAYKTYPIVSAEKFDSYNKKLNKKRQTLKSYRIEDYDDSIPSEEVLKKLDEAEVLKCFDYFEITRVEEQKDPILFGRINGCPDKFFIAQWGDDVKVEDILLGELPND